MTSVPAIEQSVEVIDDFGPSESRSRRKWPVTSVQVIEESSEVIDDFSPSHL